MPKLFFVMKDVQVEGANATTSYLTNAYPTSSILGMAEAFAFQLKQSDLADELLEEPVQALSIIKHFEFQAGKKAFPAFHKSGGAAHKSMSPSEITLSESLCNFTATLVFAISFHRGVDVEDELLPKWQTFLQRARVAGGKITNLEKVQMDLVFRSVSSLEEALTYEKGWVVEDASDEFETVVEEFDVTEAVRQFTFTYIAEETVNGVKQKHYSKKQKGWYFLDLLGYQFLEEPRKRNGTRFDQPHVFAEPVVTAKKLSYFRLNRLDELFWQWHNAKESVWLTQVEL
ncbi:type I-F CRISPR-associated protein Csy2 [Thiomicrorhabdus indica]|uniref:type I-F CRISPR-associated protein Csy2 n=1 Tax=Thiomicrorhabdus indica TaxID=2267253 RepID=UPI00102DE4D4|nr:type I-F CRISPR-associated protein Csy2 [Thiomicrorhabdus indica]